MATLDSLFAMVKFDELQAEIDSYNLRVSNVCKEEGGFTFSLTGDTQSPARFIEEAFMPGADLERVAEVISCIESA